MGKLQDAIEEVIDNAYARGLDGGKTAKRLIEAGLKMMAEAGDLDRDNRIVPHFLGGEFNGFSVSTFTPYVPEPGEHMTASQARHHLELAFGEMTIKPNESYVVATDEDGDGFSVEAVNNVSPALVKSTLVEAAETFDFYARNHIAKGPEHLDKARRNIAMARACNLALDREYVAPIIPSESTAFLLDDLAAVPPGQGLQELADWNPELPAERLTAITGDIPEVELLVRYIDQKRAAAVEKSRKASSQADKDRLDWVTRVLAEMAYEVTQGLHLPLTQIDGRVIPYNEDRDTGIRHAANLRLFFQDVHARNVKAGWWSDIATGDPKKRSVGELLMLFVTEIAEAYEAYTNDDRDDKLPDYPGFGVELADLGIRWADLCGAAMAGRVVEYHGVRNPGDEMFQEIAAIAARYEAIRKTPEAIGEPETGPFLLTMDIAEMTDVKLDYNAKREDHKIENRLKEDGKRT